MRVVVQVLLYNEPFDEIDRLLASLEHVDYPKEDWCLVIVNNRCQGHNVAEHFDRRWQGAVGVTLPETIFHAQENNGFAGGHNDAYALAKTFTPEAIYLLNGDAEVDPGFLFEVVATANAQPGAGVVQSRIMLGQEKDLVNSIGNCLHFLGFGYTDGHRQPLVEALTATKAHFYGSGAGLLIKTAVIEKAGGLFYPDFFMYHDDVDLCWRTRLLGYTIVLSSASVVYHYYEFSKSITKFYWMERNRHLTNLINYRLPTLLLIAPAALIMELGTFAFALKSGWWKEKIRSWTFFLLPSTWKMIQKRRAEVCRFRICSDRAMLTQMVGVIEAQEVKNPIVTYLVNPVLSVYFLLLQTIVHW